MRSIKLFVKYIISELFKLPWKLLSVFIPVKNNRIMFECFLGKQYSCNPRAIFEHLQKEYSDKLEFVWVYRNDDAYKLMSELKDVKLCKYRSFKHYMYSITSKVIVTNVKRSNDLPIIKKCTCIQTWHGGGCYKKIGTSKPTTSKIERFSQKKMIEAFSKETKYFISSSKYFSEHVIRNQYNYTGEILETGMPRNDVMVNGISDSKKSDIKNRINLPEDRILVLYAPTYRDEFMSGEYQRLDISKLREAIEKKFSKKAVIAYRGHHMPERNKNDVFDLDLSKYPDMQDLLLVADVLITDYSSSIWDFSYTYKPCFLYTPDLKEYEVARGFDEDIRTWGFLVCETNDILCDSIMNYSSEEHKSKMVAHQNNLVSFETGHATEKVCDVIIREIGKEK